MLLDSPNGAQVDLLVLATALVGIVAAVFLATAL